VNMMIVVLINLFNHRKFGSNLSQARFLRRRGGERERRKRKKGRPKKEKNKHTGKKEWARQGDLCGVQLDEEKLF